MPRFSANLGFLWADLPLLDRIARAADAGFPAVELHWPYDVPSSKVKAACAAHGVRLLGLNTVVGDASRGERGLGALAGRQADFQAAVDQSLAYCRESGAISVHAMAGNVPMEHRTEAREVFRRNLTEAAAKARAAGIMIVLEPLNPRDAPGYFYSTLAEAAGLIADVGADNIRLMFDAYHVGVTEGDVIARLRQYWPLIGHVQIAAVPSRAEPDEGELDFRAFFAELDALGYAGFVGCEYRPRGQVEAGLEWVRTLGVSL